MSAANAEQRAAWASEVLGPVMHDYIERLHLALSMRARSGPTHALLCTRAGVRIGHLLDLYLRRRAGDLPAYTTTLFGTSRLLAAKACFKTFPQVTLDILYKEFRPYSVRRAVEAIFPEQLHDQLDLGRLEKPLGGDLSVALDRWMLDRLFFDGNASSQALRDWYASECDRYLTYVDGVLGDGAAPVLVDTGWAGTQQRLLTRARPSMGWFGLNFGRWGVPGGEAALRSNMRGLMFESDRYDPARPATSVLHNHHIVEDVLEPPIASLSACDDLATIAKIDQDRGLIRENDDHFIGVCQYFRDVGRQGAMGLAKARSAALQRLAQTLRSPTREDAELASPRARSADFGKDEENPVLLWPEEHLDQTRENRERRSLWKQGQAALEDDGPAREAAQAQLNGIGAAPAMDPTGSVAIVTRTKDRAVLLRRAAESVAKQTYKSYQWIVVNDAGAPEPVEAAVLSSAVDLRNVRIVHRSQSSGMEAASNAGFKAAVASDYGVVHDDDDTWEPSFLAKAIAYLDHPPTPHHRGVVTLSNRISELVVDDDYSEIISIEPYNEHLRSIGFEALSQTNLFPPISFVFARDIYDKIGGFNEALPVLGDWDFNINVLELAEIGVLREALANYFHRDLQRKGDISNSVIGSVDKHALYDTATRNDAFREAPLFFRSRENGRRVLPPTAIPSREFRRALSQGGPSRADMGGPGGGADIAATLQDMQAQIARLQEVCYRLVAVADDASSGFERSKLRVSKSVLSDFKNAEINDIATTDDYSHVQVILTGLEKIDDHSWFYFRLSEFKGRPAIDVPNNGANFRYLGLRPGDAKRLIIRRDEGPLLDGGSGSDSIGLPNDFFEVVERGLITAAAGRGVISDAALAFWIKALRQISSGDSRAGAG